MRYGIKSISIIDEGGFTKQLDSGSANQFLSSDLTWKTVDGGGGSLIEAPDINGIYQLINTTSGEEGSKLKVLSWATPSFTYNSLYNSIKSINAESTNGNYSLAFGSGSAASGNSSIAFGATSNISSGGAYSLSFGYGSNTSAQSSIAFGESSSASGTYSIAFGALATATAVGSFAFGYATLATGEMQSVLGRYNEADANKAFIIGAGTTEESRNNVFTIDWVGDVICHDINANKFTGQTLIDAELESGEYNEIGVNSAGEITIVPENYFRKISYETFSIGGTDVATAVQISNNTGVSEKIVFIDPDIEATPQTVSYFKAPVASDHNYGDRVSIYCSSGNETYKYVLTPNTGEYFYDLTGVQYTDGVESSYGNKLELVCLSKSGAKAWYISRVALMA